jgi:tetratricopeptide (TPR) repeat protein
VRELGADGEAAWQSLRQHAEWAEGVWFGWVFVAAPVAVRELIERLDGLPSAKGPSLVLPLESAEATIERLFSAESRERRAVWIVGQGLAIAAWESLHLLLNERRERIRRHLGGPLIFAGRPEWKERTRDAAPDLWSQRVVVLEWTPEATGVVQTERPRAEAPTGPIEDRALVERGLARARERGDREGEAVALTRLAAVQMSEGSPGDAHGSAARAVDLAPEGPTRARALAALAGAELALGDVATAAERWGAALEQGVEGDEAAWWAIERGRALREVDRPQEAAGAFERGATLAEGERTRAASLDELGSVQLVLGNLDEAGRAIRETVVLARGLMAQSDAPDEALRDLSVSLNRLGDVERARGDLDAARAAFAEALELRRRIRARQGEVHEVLRDVSVSLERLADVDLTRGDLEAARTAFAESLELRRRLPEALRDLSIALNNFGDVERDRGELDAARAAFAESLDLCRQLRFRRGDLPEVLRGIAVTLERLGDVDRVRGDLDAARVGYAECLDLCRHLRSRRGHLPEVIRDLAIAAGHLHRVAPSPTLLAEAQDLALTLTARWPSPHHQQVADWIASLR